METLNDRINSFVQPLMFRQFEVDTENGFAP